MAIPNAPWDRLFADLKISIPSAVDAAIRQELWRTVEDFLSSTNAWIEEITFKVLPGQVEYVVTPTSNSVIDKLMMVFDPTVSSPHKQWVQQGITFAPPDKIRLTYVPSTEATWAAAVAKNITDPADPQGYPTFDADAVWIVDRYRDAFRSGTLGNLMMQPAKPYSNAKLAASNWQSYVDQRGKARADILHGNIYGGQSWRFPQGYATISRKGWT